MNTGRYLTENTGTARYLAIKTGAGRYLTSTISDINMYRFTVGPVRYDIYNYDHDSFLWNWVKSWVIDSLTNWINEKGDMTNIELKAYWSSTIGDCLALYLWLDVFEDVQKQL